VSRPLSTISLELGSDARSVTLARAMLSATAEVLGIEGELLDDVNIAVSEACNNVVLHAYGSAVGPLLVDVQLLDGGIDVLVRDRGVGIADRVPSEGRLGVGLPLMEALAHRASFGPRPGGGTEVRLGFACQWRWSRPLQGRGRADAVVDPGLEGDVVVRVCEVPLLEAVMGRLATMVAAGARFSLDRLSDVRLVTDAIAAGCADAAPDRQIGFALTSVLRRLELTIGPFDAVGAERLRQRLTSSLSSLPLRLADELEFEPLGGLTVARAVITDRRSGLVGRPLENL